MLSSCLAANPHSKSDTELHSWEVLAEIISNHVCRDILVDLGMGVKARNVQYNCRVLCTYRKVFAIRAKQGTYKLGICPSSDIHAPPPPPPLCPSRSVAVG